MSVNTNPSKFRRIDVDLFTEDPFSEEIGEKQIIDLDYSQKVEYLQTHICSLLTRGQVIEALHIVLLEPPLKCKDQLVKDMAFNCVMQVLVNIKGTERIEEAIASLDRDSVDILMKYIYRGFELPSAANVNCASLLIWHEKLTAKGGLGSIIRVMTDTRRV